MNDTATRKMPGIRDVFVDEPGRTITNGSFSTPALFRSRGHRRPFDPVSDAGKKTIQIDWEPFDDYTGKCYVFTAGSAGLNLS